MQESHKKVAGCMRETGVRHTAKAVLNWVQVMDKASRVDAFVDGFSD